MLNYLKYSVTFPSTGDTLSGEVSFHKGMTAIIGPNWSGKSFGSIELLRYMLFGKKALRGPATDYKSLAATMVCTIAGIRYRIERTSKKESLVREEDDEVLAVNTEAVNQKVVELLGFGLDIFDFVCAAEQGEVQKLSKLKPAARKQLIDRLLRLQPQEMVEKACKDKAKDHRTRAAALSSTLRAPVSPEIPENCIPSKVLEECIREARELKAQRDRLTIARKEYPLAPQGQWKDVTELALEVELWKDLRHQRQMLEKAIEGHTFEMRYSERVLADTEEYLDYLEEVNRRGSQPTLTIEQIEEYEYEWSVAEFGSLEVECPGCGLEFSPAKETGDPEWSKKDLGAQRQAHARWSSPLVWSKAIPLKLTRSEIESHRRGAAEDLRVQSLIAELDSLPPLGPDLTAEVHEQLSTNARWDAYEGTVVTIDEHNAMVDDADRQLALLPQQSEDIDALWARLSEANVYETQLASYENDLARYDTLSKEIAEEQQLADDFASGASAINTARIQVKAHLAPAISRVASSLITTMTGGKLTSIVVDENMEIMVGSQDISTLSGAGKTVANLALRIAMGQVLTARVFPMFIGDEIDSDMDGENSPATTEALASLTDHLNQVILITHKQVELADHIVIHPLTA